MNRLSTEPVSPQLLNRPYLFLPTRCLARGPPLGSSRLLRVDPIFRPLSLGASGPTFWLLSPTASGPRFRPLSPVASGPDFRPLSLRAFSPPGDSSNLLSAGLPPVSPRLYKATGYVQPFLVAHIDAQKLPGIILVEISHLHHFWLSPSWMISLSSMHSFGSTCGRTSSSPSFHDSHTIIHKEAFFILLLIFIIFSSCPQSPKSSCTDRPRPALSPPKASDVATTSVPARLQLYNFWQSSYSQRVRIALNLNVLVKTSSPFRYHHPESRLLADNFISKYSNHRD
ncbi:hypothetical protein KSP39_PZI007500 [Platanthera zijinensis]|uniref:Uncharacterized protein n=1 Tax=Platanthera zijinensis TaxID=2320716 RepID=A0AAP0BQ40_9ASPA